MKNMLKNKTTRTNMLTYLLVTVTFIVLQVMSSQGMLKSSVNGYLVPVCCYIVLAVSLNLLVGVCGELSLGHAGFMGIGAFTGIVITDPEIYFYGLSIGASFEEFESVMAANGFAVTKESDDRFYAEKGRFTIRFNGDSIKISVSVTNKTGIVF